MTHPRVCPVHSNKTLYRAFWTLVVLVLCLSLTLTMTISILLKPKVIQVIDGETVVIQLDLPYSTDLEINHDPGHP